MDDSNMRATMDTHGSKRKVQPPFIPAFNLFALIPQKLQSRVQTMRSGDKVKNIIFPTKKGSYADMEVHLEKQMQAWGENPNWVDPPPDIRVTTPKGSFCNLNVNFKVGLPPDAIYNIVIDPENKRVFKNIKEVISRKVLVDEGFRQVIEVEQAALWRFLWWSGTISVHVYVDQNRNDHTVKFKQGKTGFMKRFEGSWKVEPLFVDEQSCYPYKPETWSDYHTCTRGKGRVGSIVSLEQLIQPAILPPPPISWYLRGITSRTTEMLIHDLIAETARLRGTIDKTLDTGEGELDRTPTSNVNDDIKKRWRSRRDNRRQKSHKWLSG
ncbi:hypothetical protein QJS04_geneDACA002822 [Acorus gramineus]|uniref:DUF220 domain-containing protein n=1 Tax=Acorus gramineus TaxID=55184 RepID=A0AAV9BVC6_ACOGR|nr:hypothetical protein QJS04_geneDACA002822 [Acorus gramineus]